MGWMIGMGSPNRKTIVIKDMHGNAVGTVSVTKPGKKKTKRLKYNFKEISAQIMRAQTSGNAGRVASKAQNKVAMLRLLLKNENYDSAELKSAIAHAMKMERVAKKRMKHLQQEEKIERQGGGCCSAPDEAEEKLSFDVDNSEIKELKAKEKELKRLMREYERVMKKSMDEAMERFSEIPEDSDLSGQILEAVPEDMSPEDLRMLKKKHRAKEMKEIMEADLQYLKAMFERLAKEKQEIGTGSSDSNVGDYGVAVELTGVEMPVQVTEAPVVTEGGSVDVMV